MKKILSIFTLSLLQSSLSLAQGIGDISIEPKNPTLNQPIKITINSNGDTPACGLQINLGDGNTRDVRVEKFPVVIDHTYAKEGNFSIAVNGKMIMRGLSSLFPCGGDTKTLAVGIGTQNTSINSAQVAPVSNNNPVAQIGNVMQGMQREMDKPNQNTQQQTQPQVQRQSVDLKSHMTKEADNANYLTQSISDRFKASKIYKCQFRDNVQFPLETKFFAFLNEANMRHGSCNTKESLCVTGSTKPFTSKSFPDKDGTIDGGFLVQWSPVKKEGNTFTWTLDHGGVTKTFQLEEDTNTMYYKYTKVEKFSCSKVK